MSDVAPEPARVRGAPHPLHPQTLIGHAPAEAPVLPAFTGTRLHLSLIHI